MKKPCTQTKCQFHQTRQQSDCCPTCAECGAEPHIIEDDLCVNCWNCMSDEGYIRKGEVKVAENKIKIMVVRKK
jgi:hypothetical protein